MILYLDSSALVKLYVNEADSEVVRGLVRKAITVATSKIAYPEIRAALSERMRELVLTGAEYQAACAALTDQWSCFGVEEVNEVRAGELAQTHQLRGFEAIHLAAALDICEKARPIEVIFCTFDKRQTQAAQAEGFQTEPF